MLLDKVSCR